MIQWLWVMHESLCSLSSRTVREGLYVCVYEEDVGEVSYPQKQELTQEAVLSLTWIIERFWGSASFPWKDSESLGPVLAGQSYQGYYSYLLPVSFLSHQDKVKFVLWVAFILRQVHVTYLTLNSWKSSCFCLLNAGIRGMSHHTYLCSRLLITFFF